MMSCIRKEDAKVADENLDGADKSVRLRKRETPKQQMKIWPRMATMSRLREGDARAAD